MISMDIPDQIGNSTFDISVAMRLHEKQREHDRIYNKTNLHSYPQIKFNDNLKNKGQNTQIIQTLTARVRAHHADISIIGNRQ